MPDRSPAASPWERRRRSGATPACRALRPARRPNASSRDDGRAAVVIEGEAHLGKTELGHGGAEVCLGLGVEQEEAAPSGADELASGGAGGDSLSDPVVNLLMNCVR